jgi:sarcosine oxidase
MPAMGSYDVIVVGVGGMGSAALYHLARRGVRVLGLERFDVPHTQGSSHGKTRIIRKAYFEHPSYVPLLNRAYSLWSDLEARSGLSLFVRCGLLTLGSPDSPVFRGTMASADLHRIDVERLSIDDVLDRFPGFLPNADMEGIFESDAGFLRVEDCTKAHADAAVAAGAELRTGCRVTGWTPSGEGVRVETDAGVFGAGRLVICGGAWSTDLLRSLALPLTVRRKVMLWFAADAERYGVNRRCPAFAFDLPEGFFYGFPVTDARGMKVAEHSGGATMPSADAVDRELHAEDQIRVERFVASHLPGVSSTLTNHCVCLYTMTPDEHFVIDVHPQLPQVSFAAGFSGHGYKFAPIIGSILADLATKGATTEPIDFLRLKRLALGAGA